MEGEGGKEQLTPLDQQSYFVDTNCSLVSRLAKEGIWIKGTINNVAVDIFVDIGANILLICFDFWGKICIGRNSTYQNL